MLNPLLDKYEDNKYRGAEEVAPCDHRLSRSLGSLRDRETSYVCV